MKNRRFRGTMAARQENKGTTLMPCIGHHLGSLVFPSHDRVVPKSLNDMLTMAAEKDPPDQGAAQRC